MAPTKNKYRRVFLAIACAIPVAPVGQVFAATNPDCDAFLATTPAAFETVATLRGKEQQRWNVRLPANASVVVSATEDGLDLALEVTREGDGVVVGRAASPVQRHGTQRVVFVTKEARGYVVTVSGKEHPDAVGKASVRATVMPATEPSLCRAVLREFATGDTKFAAAEMTTGDAAPQYEAAASAYKNAAALLEASNPSLLKAQALHAEAAVFHQALHDWARAKISASNTALAYEKAGDPYGRQKARLIEAEASMELATAQSGELPRIRTQLDEIAQFHAKRGERYDEAIALNNIGIVYYQESRFDDALRLLRRAAPLYERQQEKPRQAQVLTNIAAVEYELGRLSDAIAHYQEVLPLFRPEDNRTQFAIVKNNSGVARWAIGNHDEALKELGEALSSAREVQDKYWQAISLHNLGSVYASLGDQDRALDFYRQALELRTTDLDPSRRISSLRTIGNILREQGKLDEALKMHRDALALTSAPSVRSLILLQVAKDLGAQGNVREALQQLDPILKPAGIGDEVTRARALAIRGQYAPAERDLRDAITVFHRYELTADEFDSWLTLARLMRQRGTPDAAMTAIDKALALAEEVRLQSANPELRATLMQPLQPAFDLKIEMLAERYFERTSKPDERERIARLALTTAERSRARALADFQSLDISAPGVPPELAQQRRKIYQELAARRFGLARSIDRVGPNDVRVRTISADIALLRRQLDEIDARIGAASNRVSTSSSGGARISSDTRAVPADTAVVEYWLGKERALAWIVTRDSVAMARLDATSTITETARSFYEALRSFDSVPVERRLALGTRMYDLIVKPLAPLTRRKLVFVPDGALHYIPFAALRTNARFLIETHDVVSAPSLAMMLNTSGRKGMAGREMLVVADPVYGLDDLRLGARAEQPAKDRTHIWPLNLIMRGGQVEGPLARLPGSAREAATITEAFPKGSVDRLEGFTATRDRFLGAGLERYQFIHIAAHAIADSEVPQASALLLSRFDNRSQEIDGRVLAADFMNVQLNAQTVVLSACDTAMGKNISGEGLMGLRYVVLARGARAVIASMWPVADQVSAELMAHFYGTLLRNQRRVAPALSDAMRAEIAGRFKDPGLWAAYALTVADLDET